MGDFEEALAVEAQRGSGKSIDILGASNLSLLLHDLKRTAVRGQRLDNQGSQETRRVQLLLGGQAFDFVSGEGAIESSDAGHFANESVSAVAVRADAEREFVGADGGGFLDDDGFGGIRRGCGDVVRFGQRFSFQNGYGS